MKHIKIMAIIVGLVAVVFFSQHMVQGQRTTTTPSSSPTVTVPEGAPSTGREL